MSDFVPSESLNWTCIQNQTPGPPPISFYGLPPVYLLFLARAAVAGLAIWFWRNPAGPPVELLDGADQNPEIPLEEEARPRGLQIPPDPAIAGEEQPHWIDASQVAAATRALCDYMEGAPIRDGRYPALDHLEAGAVDLIVPMSMLRLQQMLAGLPQAQRLETLRTACPRFSDALEDPSILRIDPKVFSDPCELTKESTKNWVMKWKITTKLLCLIWHQLDLQNQQLCQELKEECFAEVADQSVENILKDAWSFSDAKWSASHIIYMRHIFDTLVEILYSIQQLPSSRREIIHNEVTAIFGKMVNCFSGILGETASEMYRTEVDIHPATNFFILALECFSNRRGILQAVLAPQDYTIDLCTCWFSKLTEDAERKFRIEEDRSCISILNNTCFVWQKRWDTSGFLSSELVERLDSLIQEYIKCYLDKYWVPLLKYLEVDPLRRPRRSSLDRFTGKFNRICECQRKWKVLAELKNRLRKEIVSLIGVPYKRFLDELQTDGSSAPSSLFWKLFRKEEKKIYTVEDLEKEVTALFEK